MNFAKALEKLKDAVVSVLNKFFELFEKVLNAFPDMTAAAPRVGGLRGVRLDVHNNEYEYTISRGKHRDEVTT